MTQRTVVDLLDDFFGGSWTASSVDRLSDDEIHALGVDVDHFYRQYRLPQQRAGRLRIYNGGAAWFSNFAFAPQTRIVNAAEILPFAHASVLYADEVVLDCPLDAWVSSYRKYPLPHSFDALSGTTITPLASADTYGKGFKHASADESRYWMKLALAKLEFLAPAIRKGWLLPIPHLRYWRKHKRAILTQVQKDTVDLDMYETITRTSYTLRPAVSDAVRGLEIFPTEGIVPHHNMYAHIESASIYFNSVLAAADAADAKFVPAADSDLALLTRKISQTMEQSRQIRDALTIGALKTVTLPTFDEEVFSTICDIRESEAAFQDWRDGLATIANGQIFGTNPDVDTAQSIVVERIDEYVDRLRLGIEREQSLLGRLETARANGREFGVDVSMAAVAWLLTPGMSALKLASTVAGPIAKRALKAVAPTSDGAASVVLQLDRHRQS